MVYLLAAHELHDEGVTFSFLFKRIVIEVAFTEEMTFTTVITHRSTIHDITQADTSSLLFISTRHLYVLGT